MSIHRVLIPILVLLAMVAGAVSLLAGPGASAQSGDEEAQAQSSEAAPEEVEPEAAQAHLELTIWQGVEEPLDFWISSRADEESEWSRAEVELALQLGGGWRVGELTVTAGDHDFELRLWHDPAETDEDADEVWLSARLAGELWSDYGTQQLTLDQVTESGVWNYANLSLALPLRSPEEPNEDPEYVAVGVCPPEDQTKTYAYIYVWQRKTALESFWITSRTASNQKWQTVKLSMSLTEAEAADDEDADATEDSDGQEEAGADEEQSWNTGDLTIAGRRGALDLRLWQDADDLRNVWLSARSSGAGWDDYGTKQWALDRSSRSGKYWYRLQTVSVAVPENEAAEPGRSTTNWAGWDCNSAPTANAGEDQTVNANVRVALDGTGSSDPDGDALTYAWSGPEGITLADADTDTATFTTTTAQVGQTLTFTLTVTDPGGKSGSDEVEITVRRPAPVFGGGGGGGGAPPTSPGQQAPNQAPTANAGPDQHVGPGASVEVTLDGSGSSDPDGDTLTHRWRHTGGTYDGSGSFTIGNGETPTFALPSDATLGETLIITLTVSDGKGGSDTDTVTITANNAPTVNASTDANVKRNRTIALNGSNASDTDGTIAGYLWEHTDEGTYSGDRISLNSPNNLSSSYKVPSDANVGDTITFTLTVTDNHGGTGTASVTSTVINDTPIAHAGANQNANRASIVTLDGSSSSDNDGTISSYSWTHTDGTYGTTLSSLSGMSPTFTAPTDAEINDTIIFTLTVTDNDNGTNTNTNTNTVTITLKNAPPTVSVGADINATRGIDTSATATVNDPDGDNDDITYFWEGAPLFVLLDPSKQTTRLRIDASEPMNTEYTIKVTVTDEDNGTAEDSLTLTVNNDPPTAPNAGSDQSVARGNTASLSGTASTDPDGDTVTYSWAKTSGYADVIDIANSTSLTGASFSVPTDATTNAGIVITLTASDGKGGTATDTVTITATNVAPTADAGADADANRGSTVTLDGSGSNDEHGTLSFSWAQDATSPNCTETVTLSSTTAQKPTFTVPTACAANSTLSFTLTVTDVDNETNSDTVTIKAKNVGPTADAGADVSAAAGASVNLSGTASDVEDSTLTAAWTVSGTPTATLSIETTGALTPTLNVPEHASPNTTYTVTLKVTDSDNASATDSLTVTVSAANSGPSSADAGEDQTVNQGTTVNLSGSGSDPENDPLTYSWKKTGGTYSGTLADLSGQTPTFSAPNLTGLTSGSQSKTIVWTLTVSDSAGRTATDTVTITVQNAAPTVSISNVNLTAGNTVGLSATVNDPDGSNSAMGYSWSVTGKSSGAPDASLTSATTATPGLVVSSSAWQASPHHTYTVSVTVTDEDGATASDSATLTVNNRPPVADVQGTTSARPGETVHLIGLQSSDPDGDTVSCTFAKTGGTYPWGITIVNNGYCSGASYTVPSNAVSMETIIVTMTVTDSKGGTATDEWTTTVRQ